MTASSPPGRTGPVARIALAILFVNELIVGGWNQIAPESFYEHFPTVDLTPPFSEHYARDFGGATLGIAVILGLAVVIPRVEFGFSAAVAYTVFAVPHFVFHAFHLEDATTAAAVFLILGNAIVAVLGLFVALSTRAAVTGLRRTRTPRPGSAV